MASEAKVVLYGTRFCPYCIAAKNLLKKKGVSYEEILVSGGGEVRREIALRSGQNTVPQIFIADQPIGGFDELYELEQDGDLDALLQQA